MLKELSQAQDEAAQSATGADAFLLGKLQSIIQFVTNWQDYLAFSAVGNMASAQQTLQNLSNPNTSQEYLIPRSEILAREASIIQPPADENSGADNNQDTKQSSSETWTDGPPVEKPLWWDKSTHKMGFSVATLDDLQPIINAFDHMRGEPEFRSYADPIDAALKALRPLNDAYVQWKSGLAVKLDIPLGQFEAGDLQTSLIPLRAQLITLALPRVLGLPPRIKANPGEGAYDFLKRTEVDAIAKGDFLLAARARDTGRQLLEAKPSDERPQPGMPNFYRRMAPQFGPFGDDTPPVSNDSEAADLYQIAHNQDIAGQYAHAVNFYEQALAVGSDLVPPKVIGDRLAAIKSEHPDDFKNGLDTYLSPPWLHYPGLPPGMKRRAGFPNRPEPGSTLAVPAASASPAASGTSAK